MTATRDPGDISTDPGGKTGREWTTDVRDSLVALWQLSGGALINVSGTNAITADVLIGTSFSAYSDGMEVSFLPVANNTGPCSLNIGGVGGKALVDPDGNALVANSLIAARLTKAIFIAANDHLRLTASGGTTNVTVQGGIILQRKAPSRLAVQTSSTTDAETVASQTMQAAYSDSRIIIEGAVSAIVASGVADSDGLTLELLVDGNVEDTITDYINPGQKQTTPFTFEHSPGDINSHTYAIQVTPTIAAAFAASSTFIVCSEMSPNP